MTSSSESLIIENAGLSFVIEESRCESSKALIHKVKEVGTYAYSLCNTPRTYVDRILVDAQERTHKPLCTNKNSEDRTEP